MNQQIDRSGAAAKLGLGLSPVGGVAVVFGASGGIGGALAEALRKAETFAHVIALSRASAPAIDLLAVAEPLTYEANGGFFDWRGQPIPW
jgi:NAD(P)-dependent dehydrogenase (short-subunit alcohol dehydrogenase family)